jgi:TonB family protein
MIDFLIYDLKLAVLIVVFYMFYRLMLARDTCHRVNRIVLLMTAVASFVLPLCVITMHETQLVDSELLDIGALAPTDVGEIGVVREEHTPWWEISLPAVFIIGVVATLCHTLWSVFRIISLIRRSEQHPQDDGTTICVTSLAGLAPFSWMRYIVMNRSDYEAGDAAILTHERAHIRLRHSWDVLLVDILTALQWFNPAIWMLRSDLRAIHEYEADGEVLSLGISARQYQYLLITKAASIGGYSLANGISHSTLKNRITMMTNRNSKSSHLLKLLALLPIVGTALALNARTVTDYVYDEPQKQVPVKKGKANANIKTASGINLQVVATDEGEKEASQASDVEKFFIKGKVLNGDIADHTPIVGAVVKVVGSNYGTITDREGNFRMEVAAGDRIEVMYVGYDTFTIGVSKAYSQDHEYIIDLNKETADPDRAFDVVENMPKFPGGQTALMEYLVRSVRYPLDAEEAGIQGRVIATFVVEKDGSISNARIVKSVYPSLDAEALRVVNSMPDWEPGTQNGKPVRVKYTVPITFRLQGGADTKEAGKREEANMLNEMVVVGFGKQTSSENQPLYIVDGVTMEPEKIKTLDPKSIDHIEVLKNKWSIEKYGAKGKNGVVIITTKK